MIVFDAAHNIAECCRARRPCRSSSPASPPSSTSTRPSRCCRCSPGRFDASHLRRQPDGHGADDRGRARRAGRRPARRSHRPPARDRRLGVRCWRSRPRSRRRRTTLPQLIVWRFVQGLATPGVFASTIAYIHDEWPPSHVGPGHGGVHQRHGHRRLHRPRARRASWRRGGQLADGVRRARRCSTLAAACAVASGCRANGRAPRPGAAATGRSVAAAAAQPAADRDLRRRLLRAVHAGRDVHLRDVSPRRAAVRPEHRGARLAVRRLPGRRGGHAVRRALDRRATAIAPASASGDGDRRRRRAADARAVAAGDRRRPGAVSPPASSSRRRPRAATSARSRPTDRGARGRPVFDLSTTPAAALGGALPALFWNAGGWPACVALVVAVQLVDADARVEVLDAVGATQTRCPSRRCDSERSRGVRRIESDAQTSVRDGQRNRLGRRARLRRNAEQLPQLVAFHHFDLEQAPRDRLELVAVLGRGSAAPCRAPRSGCA